MTSMTTEAVLRVIQQAAELEQRGSGLQRQISERLQLLPPMIAIDDPQPALCLLRFAIEYIEMAPRLIECVEACAQEAQASALFTPFISAALNFFAQPSPALAQYDGLDGLLIKAYLCHRLMEDLYENNKSIRNSQLVDVEATQANLLVHHLLGEPFANELDQTIQQLGLQIAGSPDYYELDLKPFVQQASHAAWNWMRHYWLNLLERNHIYFRFSYRQAF